MEHHAVAWESATVTRGARDFELAVRLSAQPSSDWDSLFNQAAEKEGLMPQGRGWSHLRLSGETISMRELRADAREEARRYVDDIVSRTNAALAARLEEQEQERIRAEREEAELLRQAEELTEWFRSVAGAPRQIAPPPAAPESANSPGSEQADLRDRLVHAFRTDTA